ncbi:MAG: hypothetical protein MUF07_08655 [Steroidobacteraceae bacterium]|jgi:hypothetical protein|nr:hypothetical protein [Steroidobacteraceae bacterium]
MNSKHASRPPPAWLRRLLPLALVVGALAVWWSPDGAPGDAPSRPCPAIGRAAFDAALAAGAVRGVARIAADGTLELDFGPGVVGCATQRGLAVRPCRRPDELVVEVLQDGAAPAYVRVPAGAEYRFRAGRGAQACEILER